jgi:hypothetical protein
MIPPLRSVNSDLPVSRSGDRCRAAQIDDKASKKKARVKRAVLP